MSDTEMPDYDPSYDELLPPAFRFMELPDELRSLVASFLHPEDLRNLKNANKAMAARFEKMLVEKAVEHAIKGREMHEAIEFNNHRVISSFLNMGVDVNCHDTDGKTLLMVAIERNRLALVDWLIDEWEADPDLGHRDLASGPLSVAAFQKRHLFVQLLLDKGVQVTPMALWEIAANCDAHLFHITATRVGPELLQTTWRWGTVLLDEEEPARDGDTLLHAAARNIEFPEVFQEIYERIPEHVHTPNSNNCTPAMIAVMHGHPLAFQVVYANEQQQMNLSLKDKATGNNILQLAIDMDDVTVANILAREPRMTVNRINLEGETALHMAIHGRMRSTIRLLIDRDDINLSVRDNLGSTPLHRAAAAGNKPVIIALLERGANNRITDRAGRSAAQLVPSLRPDIATLIEEYNLVPPTDPNPQPQ